MTTLDGIKPGDLLIEGAQGMGDVVVHRVTRLTKIYAITAGPHIDHKWRLSDGKQPGEMGAFQSRRRLRKPEPGELDAIERRRRFYGLMRHLEEAAKEASKDLMRPTAADLAVAEKALALVQSLLEPATEVQP